MLTYYHPRKFLALLVIAVAPFVTGAATLLANNDTAAIDFNRDIRPILSAHCYQCHGPDERDEQRDGMETDSSVVGVEWGLKPEFGQDAEPEHRAEDRDQKTVSTGVHDERVIVDSAKRSVK